MTDPTIDILSVNIKPNPVYAGEQFIISVEAKEIIYDIKTYYKPAVTQFEVENIAVEKVITVLLDENGNRLLDENGTVLLDPENN